MTTAPKGVCVIRSRGHLLKEEYDGHDGGAQGMTDAADQAHGSPSQRERHSVAVENGSRVLHRSHELEGRKRLLVGNQLLVFNRSGLRQSVQERGNNAARRLGLPRLHNARVQPARARAVATVSF
jgi:hypothetical protein